MKRSTASRGAVAILVALPLLPVCGIVLHGEPAMVFFMGEPRAEQESRKTSAELGQSAK